MSKTTKDRPGSKSGILSQFTPEDQKVIRSGLRKLSADRTPEELLLVRLYKRISWRRSKSGESKLNDLRLNQDYREWCRKKGYSVASFNRDHWEEFIREWS